MQYDNAKSFEKFNKVTKPCFKYDMKDQKNYTETLLIASLTGALVIRSFCYLHLNLTCVFYSYFIAGSKFSFPLCPYF